MKKILHALSFMFLISMPVYAQEQPAPADAQAAAPSAAAPSEIMGEKRDLILKFIDVFGTKRTMAQNLQAMFDDMGPNDPQTKKFKENVRVDEIIEQLIPLYDKYFSEENLKTYIAFYSSAEGKKLLDTIPNLMRDSVDISAKYFEAKFPAEKADTPKNAPASEANAPSAEPASASSDKSVTP